MPPPGPLDYDLAIRIDPIEDARVIALLKRHLDEMHLHTPAQSVHALDLGGLRAPEMTLWTAWDGETLLGCGGLKAMGGAEGELKSFHAAHEARGRGVARALLRTILAEARRRGYARLSLETGAPAPFAAAQALYRAHGFETCGPFGDYPDDPFSLFMTLEL